MDRNYINSYVEAAEHMHVAGKVFKMASQGIKATLEVVDQDDNTDLLSLFQSPSRAVEDDYLRGLGE